MITCPVLNEDGLGNQLFRFAACYAHARRSNSVFQYMWHHPLPYKTDEYLSIKENTGKGPNYYESPNFDFELPPVASDLNMIGYFQSEKYFADYADSVRSLFHNSDRKSEFNRSFGGGCIHVRRGDYLSIPDILPALDMSYYERAMTYAKDKWGISEWTVYTDDLNWCKEHFSDLPVYSESTYSDFTAMQFYQVNIIANSTFSWWSAWLAGHNRVIAPSQWFADEYNVTSEHIIPERWIRL